MEKKELSKMPSSPPADRKKKGCGTSFLNNKRNEMDKLCGGRSGTMMPGEYAQPDEEKETGGES